MSRPPPTCPWDCPPARESDPDPDPDPPLGGHVRPSTHHPAIEASGHRGIRPSRCPGVRVSGCPGGLTHPHVILARPAPRLPPLAAPLAAPVSRAASRPPAMCDVPSATTSTHFKRSIRYLGRAYHAASRCRDHLLRFNGGSCRCVIERGWPRGQVRRHDNHDNNACLPTPPRRRRRFVFPHSTLEARPTCWTLDGGGSGWMDGREARSARLGSARLCDEPSKCASYFSENAQPTLMNRNSRYGERG